MASIEFDLKQFSQTVQKNWNSICQGDVFFLVSFKMAEEEIFKRKANKNSFVKEHGIQYVRGCEVNGFFDENQRDICSMKSRKQICGTKRRMTIILDSN